MPYIGNIVQDFSVSTAMLNTDSVTSIKVLDGTIVNADINASAAIAGTKISPDFGSQNIATTGTLSCDTIASNDITISDQQPRLNFVDNSGSPNDPDYLFQVDGGQFVLHDSTNGVNKFAVQADGHMDFVPNCDFAAGIDVTGNITTTGSITATTGTITSQDITIQDQQPRLNFVDNAGSPNDPDYLFQVDGGSFLLHDSTNVADRFSIAANGTLRSHNNHDFSAGIDVTGAITGTGNLTLTTANPVLELAGTASTTGNTFLHINANANHWCVGADNFSSQNNFVIKSGTPDSSSHIFLINSSGRVGIGTTNPDTNLVVSSDDHTGITIESARTTATDNIGSLQFQSGSTDVALIQTLVNGTIKFRNTSSLTDRVHIDQNGTLLSFSTNDTTPNIKWRSDDTNWFGSLNQSVEGATISTFLSTGGDWSANGTTYSATKAIASFETRAIVLHPQFNNGAGKVAFLQKAAGSTTTDGTVTEILSIDNAGIKFGTSGAGIDFSATSDASGKTSELLDDYEEGNWTPVYVSSNSTISYTTQQGFYTKVGNKVVVTAYIRTSSVSSTSHSLVKVSGLPFAEAKGQRTPGSVRCNGFQGTATDFGYPVTWSVEANQSHGELQRYQSGGNGDFSTSTMNDATFVYLQCTYHTAS